MKIDTQSDEMYWILTKFLKDSLEFLSSDESKNVKRGVWIKCWQIGGLKEEQLKEWMPEKPNSVVSDGQSKDFTHSTDAYTYVTGNRKNELD